MGIARQGDARRVQRCPDPAPDRLDLAGWTSRRSLPSGSPAATWARVAVPRSAQPGDRRPPPVRLRPRERGRAGADPRLLRGRLGVRAAHVPDPVEPRRRGRVESFTPDFYLPGARPVPRADHAQAEPRAQEEPQAAPPARALSRTSGSSSSTRATSGRCCSSTGGSPSPTPLERDGGPGDAAASRDRRGRAPASRSGHGCHRPERRGARRRRSAGCDIPARIAPSRRTGRQAGPARPRRRTTADAEVDAMNGRPDLDADVAEVLITEEQIQAKVAELGARISADYAGRELTLVSVLKGSLPFMADLMRAITIPVQIDLMEVSLVRRHGDRVVGPGAHPQGPLVVHRRPRRAHRRGHHRHRPDAQLPDPLPARQEPARRSRICTLLDKPARRLVEIADRLPWASRSPTSS